MTGSALVAGAGGGIGRSLLQVLRARRGIDLDPDATDGPVMGSARRPGGMGLLDADITDENAVMHLAAQVAARMADAGDLRLVIVATGFLHGNGMSPEKALRDLDPAALAHAFAVNAIGPALLMKHLLPLLPRRGRAVFACLSARVGSIGDNGYGGWYGYRASKAALNQLVRTGSIELRRRNPEALCVALHPGTVDTPLSAPFARSGLAVQTPEAAAARLLDVIDGLEPRQSGGFFDHRGAAVPW